MRDRATLRGNKLLEHCKSAKTTTNETGLHDDRIFCYGLVDASTDAFIKECRECKANVIYAESEGEG